MLMKSIPVVRVYLSVRNVWIFTYVYRAYYTQWSIAYVVIITYFWPVLECSCCIYSKTQSHILACDQPLITKNLPSVHMQTRKWSVDQRLLPMHPNLVLYLIILPPS